MVQRAFSPSIEPKIRLIGISGFPGFSRCTAAMNILGRIGLPWTLSSLCTSKRLLPPPHGVPSSKSTRGPLSHEPIILPHRVSSLSFVDESEIVWSKFPDPGWNRWSAYQLRRKWQALKRSVSGHENLTPRGEHALIGSYPRAIPAPPQISPSM